MERQASAVGDSWAPDCDYPPWMIMRSPNTTAQ